ncbi:MAG: integrase arm-type DNA-binding domain-containing protein, partial [Gammaproteobacteria bacterium]|nr:integrase arm-type DNA-binding domain-containing protein [Gammaproteobacteria bacterium]
HVRVRVSPQAPFPTFQDSSKRSKKSCKLLLIIIILNKLHLDKFPGVSHNSTNDVAIFVGKNTGKLTAATVRTISAPGRYADGNTLFLNVTKGGSKSWVQRISVDGHRRDTGLGSFPTISLAEARKRALANRLAVADGRDPLADKKRAAAPTFREAAQATFEANRPRWRDTKTARNWMQGMEKRAFPVIGNMRVDRIRRQDILRILKPVWTVHPDVARKLRQRIRATLRWCQAHGYVEQNAAGEAIDGALPSMPAVRTHHRSLPYSEVRACLETVRASSASASARLCLEFLVLTAARSGEARGARWDEINLNAREWRVAASRMKTSTPHVVPLSDPAMQILDQARSLGDGPLVFPSPIGRKQPQPLSDMTLMKVLHTIGYGDRATVHGFRSSFRTWASECTDADHAVMELCLSHAVGNAVERAYARSDLLEKRRTLMTRWAAECAPPLPDAPTQRPSSICPGLDGPQPRPPGESAGARLTSPHQPARIPHRPPTSVDPASAPTGKLTTGTVLATSKPGRYSDGHTLYLKVAESGAKSWVQRIVVDGRRRDIGLGGFPVVSLAKARAHALANRVALSEGRDPLADTRRRRARALARSARTLHSQRPSRPDPVVSAHDTQARGGSAPPDIGDCVNNTCPWSGKPVRADSLTRHRDHVVGFCNPGCRDKFDAAVRHFEQSAGRPSRV